MKAVKKGQLLWRRWGVILHDVGGVVSRWDSIYPCVRRLLTRIRSRRKKKRMSFAPDFELPDTEGRTHRLVDYAGQWLLLVFHRHLG